MRLEIDPSGSYLLVANHISNKVVIFRIDRNTGDLTPTARPWMCLLLCVSNS